MEIIEKGRNRCNGGTLLSSTFNHYPSKVKSRIKAGIVDLALLGVLSPSQATWLIRRFHLEAE